MERDTSVFVCLFVKEFVKEIISTARRSVANNSTMAAVPLAKLGALLLRTVTKPIAKRLGERVKDSEFFRATFVQFGRGINNIQVHPGTNAGNV